jgi:ParB family chromosome partitioning protein
VLDIDDVIEGQYAENEIRKDFTPSERVAIAKAIEEQIGNRRGTAHGSTTQGGR